MKLSRIACLCTLSAAALMTSPELLAQSKKQRKAIAAANTQIENNLKTFVGVLASDSLEGRRTGTAGEAKAVAYIEQYYKQLGIPGANNGSYQQPFVIDEGKMANASLLQLDDAVLKAGTEYFPLPWSGLQSIDASSAAALQEIGSPWWYDLKEDLEANKNNPHLLPEQLIRDKAVAAAKKGATALLVYNSAAGEEVIKYNAKDRSDAVAIPVFYIQKDAVHKYKIDASVSFHVKAKAAFTQQQRNGTNVAAIINNNAAQTIILGAHLDHLGYGEDANSRHTGDAAIHNGADDNASGTAALMEVARLLKEKPNKSFNYLLAAL
ncbi:M28 family peptidase [Phnomibacter ginsenosidimutans]|uniref:M28 family peptidase n=1 Tax=Phnomibacter ginsenosidimutans TaxID=2676868 RepID=A0A6I6H680_9BACT|nr:M28 family peptidase [Phnomibacter ginsenosidimutans]QGW29821.1 M28 family peptidase [Phnomibacter ginsenosidimutans]